MASRDKPEAQSLTVKPGTVHLWGVVAGASRRWWYDWTAVLVISSVWLLAQLFVISGPPATAVLYALLQDTSAQPYWGPRDVWSEFKRLFWPAWRWALLNLIVLGIGLFNLVMYWPNSSLLWVALRLLWIAALSVWLALNFFYWPFWLAQEDQSLRNTYANCRRFLVANPLQVLVLLFVFLAILAVSLLSMLPFVLGSMAWIALAGNLAVGQALYPKAKV